MNQIKVESKCKFCGGDGIILKRPYIAVWCTGCGAECNAETVDAAVRKWERVNSQRILAHFMKIKFDTHENVPENVSKEIEDFKNAIIDCLKENGYDIGEIRFSERSGEYFIRQKLREE